MWKVLLASVSDSKAVLIALLICIYICQTAMTSPGQSIRSLNFSTSQVLGAGIAAGALALYVWKRGFSSSISSACDTPEAGNESDEIVLYGEGRPPCASVGQFGM